jgi:hypothetical protein
MLFASRLGLPSRAARFSNSGVPGQDGFSSNRPLEHFVWAVILSEISFQPPRL